MKDAYLILFAYEALAGLLLWVAGDKLSLPLLLALGELLLVSAAALLALAVVLAFYGRDEVDP